MGFEKPVVKRPDDPTDVRKSLIFNGTTLEFVPAASWNPTEGSLFSSLPRLYEYITDYNDNTAATLRVLSIGSSVGVGSTLTSPSTDAPGAYLTTAIKNKLNKLNNATITHYNGCVAGHALADSEADFSAAYAAASGTKAVCAIVFGMNDGTTDLYHNGQTLPGVRTFLRQVVADIKALKIDPIVFTTPHPHTTRKTWTNGLGAVYPASGVFIPAANTGASIVSITSSEGYTIDVSYRHLRVNELIRRTCAELGVTCIDVEKYWFRARALYSQDSLFNIGEDVHPNDLGHQQSYHAAIDNWAKGLDSATAVSTTPPPANITTDEQFNVQIANPLSIATLADKEYGVLLIRGRHPGFGSNYHVEEILVVGEGGSSGRVSSIKKLQASGSDLITVSVSSGVLTLTATNNGTDIAWTYTRGYPLL